ncbi:MAG: hypothetical protein QOI89_3764, partial [Solirubrobacteraceae bacterium]|nr:hypothetical protein [Solirubrobacteraceae bacterium]
MAVLELVRGASDGALGGGLEEDFVQVGEENGVG